jgi:hypothetical protein
LRVKYPRPIQSNWFALFVKTALSFCHCVMGGVDATRRIRGTGPQMIPAVLDHALPANSTLVDRVALATKLSLSSPLATRLSALAPAQRAEAQRLCALTLNGPQRGTAPASVGAGCGDTQSLYDLLVVAN